MSEATRISPRLMHSIRTREDVELTEKVRMSYKRCVEGGRLEEGYFAAFDSSSLELVAQSSTLQCLGDLIAEMPPHPPYLISQPRCAPNYEVKTT